MPSLSTATSPRPPRERLTELDALRGLAASIVLVAHFIIHFKSVPIWVHGLLDFTPFFILMAASQAVVLFFMLSGFVLSLPYIAQVHQTYGSFLVKRIFRIYVPYLVALTLAIIGASFFHDPKPETSLWFQGQWSGPVDPGLVVKHLLFLGSFYTMEFDSPIWSLVEEMRISILFPLFCPLILRLPWLASLLLVPFLTIADHYLRIFHLIPMELFILHHIGMFVLGIIMAKHRIKIKEFIQSLSLTSYVGLIVVTLAFLRLSQFFYYINVNIEDWCAEVAGAGLIALSLGGNRFPHFLRSSIPQFLGRVSYSLYLIHLPILLLMYSLLHQTVSMAWLFIPYVGIVLLSSAFFYRWVEKPSMEAGRKLGKWLN